MKNKFFESFRKEFPITEKYIFLDHAGVAPGCMRVRRAIETFLTQSCEGGSFHYPLWSQQILDVRQACARLINATMDEIAFVKNTSHGLSIVAEGLAWRPGDSVLVYEKEFPSNLFPWLNLRKKGVAVKFIPSREGRIQLDDIERLIDPGTRLLAVSSVQFANGFRLDLEKTGELCRRRNILFCVDAIQSLGVLPMDVRSCGIDFLSADAHKWLLGPEGIGIFYCRRDLAEKLDPALVGWKSVQHSLNFDSPEFLLRNDALRFEEGTLNVIGIIGLGAAVGLLQEVGAQKIAENVLNLGEYIIKEAEKRNFSVLTPTKREERGGNITFSGSFDPAQLLGPLREKNIMVNARGGGLRVSPHFYNTKDEILEFFGVLDGLIRC